MSIKIKLLGHSNYRTEYYAIKYRRCILNSGLRGYLRKLFPKILKNLLGYKTMCGTKALLTRMIGMGNFGSAFGIRLRQAGFEGIIIRGKSSKPVFLCWIDWKHQINRSRSSMEERYP